MSIHYSIHGSEKLEEKLKVNNKINLAEVVQRSMLQMYNRSSRRGPYQPVKTGQLRNSRRFYKRSNVGSVCTGMLTYTAEYAPHVEFGHLTRGGRGSVQGQRYLKQNVQKQGPLFRKDMLKALRK